MVFMVLKLVLAEEDRHEYRLQVGRKEGKKG